MPSWLALGIVRLPGREDRIADPVITSARVAADLVALEIAARAGELPFALLGHSLGALLAFEMSRALRRVGRRLPMLLFVSAAHAPERFRTQVSARSSMSRADLVAALRRSGGTPDTVLENEELLQLILPAFEADRRLAAAYLYEVDRPLPFPIVALQATEDANVSRSDLQSWSKQTSSDFSIRAYHGDHFSVVRDAADITSIVIDELTNRISTATRSREIVD
jgi:surfactin synthase thioesterase subunit